MEKSKRFSLTSLVGLTKRNLTLFFKDKTTLFFSFLAQLIILFLFLAFIKNAYVDQFYSIIKEYTFNDVELVTKSEISQVVNLWMVSGITATSTITVAVNCLSTVIYDKERKVSYDLLSTPISYTNIVLSYFFSAFISTYFISAIVLGVSLVILMMFGALYISALSVFMSFVVLLIGVVVSVSFLILIVGLFKKNSSYIAFSGIISAIVGFVIGAYIPLGTLGDGIQNVVNLFPSSHISGLLRNYLMDGIIKHIDSAMQGYDNHKFSESLLNTFALNIKFFGQNVGITTMFIYPTCFCVVCLSLDVVLYKYVFSRY